MPIVFNAGESALLDGHRAMLGVYGKVLNVLSDPNNTANTPDNTTVGSSFNAVTGPAAEADLTTELGLDPRFVMWAEVAQTEDPQLEATARVSDGVTNWKVVRVERNAASSVNRYWLIQIEPGKDL